MKDIYFLQCFVKNARTIRMTSIVGMLIVACHSVFLFLRLFGVRVSQRQETASVAIQTEDRRSNIKVVSASTPASVPASSNASRAPVATAAVTIETEVSSDSPRQVAASFWCAKDDKDRHLRHIYAEPYEVYV